MDLATTRRRLAYYLNSKGISPAEFYRQTGITRGLLDKDKLDTGVNDTVLAQIIGVYEEVSLTWLITGNGEMTIKGENVIVGDKNTQTIASGEMHSNKATSTGSGHIVYIGKDADFEKIIKEDAIELTQKGTLSAEAQQRYIALQIEYAAIKAESGQKDALIDELRNSNKSKDSTIEILKGLLSVNRE